VHTPFRSGVVAVLTVFSGTTALAQSSPVAVSTAVSQTSDIPVGKVATPAGLVDKACVFEIPNGGSFHPNGDVVLNGVLVDHHLPCTPEQMGRNVSETAQAQSVLPPTISHDWIDDTWAWANGSDVYIQLGATWTVPSSPPNSSYKAICQTIGSYCQVLFFFPSLQSNAEIVQPVLQYGYNGSFGSRTGWTIASWLCSNSACPHSSPVSVRSGDIIGGYINLQNTSPLQYYVQTTDRTTGAWTGQTFTTSGAPFNTAQGGVMEVYNVVSCAQYPSSHPLVTYDISILEADPSTWNWWTASPSWYTQIAVASNPNPSCSYGASATSNGTSSTASVQYSN
jgi:hypothetical protein